MILYFGAIAMMTRSRLQLPRRLQLTFIPYQVLHGDHNVDEHVVLGLRCKCTCSRWEAWRADSKSADKHMHDTFAFHRFHSKPSSRVLSFVIRLASIGWMNLNRQDVGWVNVSEAERIVSLGLHATSFAMKHKKYKWDSLKVLILCELSYYSTGIFRPE